MAKLNDLEMRLSCRRSHAGRRGLPQWRADHHDHGRGWRRSSRWRDVVHGGVAADAAAWPPAKQPERSRPVPTPLTDARLLDERMPSSGLSR
jgi:hypothetical protein